jgi:hypothetical protein
MPDVSTVHSTHELHIEKLTIMFESVHILGHLQLENAHMHLFIAIVIKNRQNHGMPLSIRLHLEGLRVDCNMQKEFSFQTLKIDSLLS